MINQPLPPSLCPKRARRTPHHRFGPIIFLQESGEAELLRTAFQRQAATLTKGQAENLKLEMALGTARKAQGQAGPGKFEQQHKAGRNGVDSQLQ